MTTQPTSPKGNPASAKPMSGLSARAQKLLEPKRYGFNVPLEPAGSGKARHFKARAKI